jgi:hypothetical protein
MEPICFNRTRFNTFVILYVLFTCYLFVVYTSYNKSSPTREKITPVDLYSDLSQDELLQRLKTCKTDLFEANMATQDCQLALGNTKMELMRKQSSSGNNNVSLGPGRNYNAESEYQQIGIIYNDTSRFPLYGRRKYANRSDKWEYYLVDESRNRLKIQYKSQNDNELYNNDTINVPVLSNAQLTVQLYEYDTYKYNPF